MTHVTQSGHDLGQPDGCGSCEVAYSTHQLERSAGGDAADDLHAENVSDIGFAQASTLAPSFTPFLYFRF